MIYFVSPTLKKCAWGYISLLSAASRRTWGSSKKTLYKGLANQTPQKNMQLLCEHPVRSAQTRAYCETVLTKAKEHEVNTLSRSLEPWMPTVQYISKTRFPTLDFY